MAGANRSGHHRTGISLEQVPQATMVDIREAHAGDPCPHCGRRAQGARVIEVGNIFQLGTKYSQPMGATYLDEQGVERDIVMGSYGIGLARIAAAAVEQHHDDHGICWPARSRRSRCTWSSCAPPTRRRPRWPTSCTTTLAERGLDVLYDDRELSPGIKFKDADLLGCPVQVVVGKRAGEGLVELKMRAGGERRDVAAAEPARLAVRPQRSSSR